MSELENENPYPKMGEVKHHLVKPTTMKETKAEIKTLLKRLMVNLNNTDELTTDMLYKLTDVFEMDAIEIFKEIKSLKQKP